MALLADRVKETTTTTGTGTVSLAGAPAGFQSFNTAFANGSLVYYVIQGGAEWEIGIGTTGTGTLARTQVLQSSNADALVPFSAGVKDVFCSYVADRAVTTVDAATLTNKTIDDYTNSVGANKTHFRIKATGTISKGSVVKATGYNPGEMAIEVAVVTSATDLVLGISEQALTTGQFGMAVVIGELFDVNTNGFTVGNIIYSNGAGGFTETKPTSGLYQALGWIVRANASNGVIAVNIVAPLYVETATNTANTSVLRDGSGNFAAGTITATLSGTATQVSQALTAGSYLTSTGTYNGGTARTFAVDATDANTASKVVARDASGNFAAGTITAALSGNATTATTADKVANALTAGTYITSTGTFDGSAARTFAVDATDANTASKVVARDGSGNFSAGTITATLNGAAPAGSLSGTTLASGVTASSLTSVGTLGSLTVSGATSLATSSGSVGVGTTSPTAKLGVTASDTLSAFTGATYGAAILRAAATTGRYTALDFSSTGDLPIARIAMYYTGGGSFLQFGTSDNYGSGITNTAMSIDPSGNLGIGTAPSTVFTGASGTTPLVQFAKTDNTTTLNLTTAALVIQNDSTTDNTGAALNFVSRNTGNTRVAHAAIYGLTGTRNSGWNTGSLIFATSTDASPPTERARIDSAGNLGLGVTPSAWNASYRAFQVGQVGTFWAHAASADVYLSANYHFDTADRYIVNGAATSYRQNSGTHAWFTAPSGTAGNAITFTQALTLDASANLLVNTTIQRGRITAVSTGYSVLALGTSSTSSARGGAINFDNESPSTRGQILYDTASDYMAFSTAATERARITSGGDVWIGASSAGPFGRNLVIDGTTSTGISLRVGGTLRGFLYADATTLQFGAPSSGAIVVKPNDVERARFDSPTVAGQTALLLYDVDNNTVERVTVGAADSGGTGYKVLRIPN